MRSAGVPRLNMQKGIDVTRRAPGEGQASNSEEVFLWMLLRLRTASEAPISTAAVATSRHRSNPGRAPSGVAIRRRRCRKESQADPCLRGSPVCSCDAGAPMTTGRIRNHCISPTVGGSPIWGATGPR